MKRSLIKAALCFLALTPVVNAQDVRTLEHFESEYVDARQVDVWLPPNYETDKNMSYPVLYMQDGQNVLNDETAMDNTSWQAGRTALDLIKQDKIGPVIIVAIWNTPDRFLEYFPENAAQYLTDSEKKQVMELAQKDGSNKKQFLGDEYLKFLVAELKPYIDSHFRTLKDAKNTAICGSSMGGLISMYAAFEYPEVFSKAAGLSTHWPVFFDNNDTNPAEAIRKYMEMHVPAPKSHRFYFDLGTASLDQYYEDHQQQVDAIMERSGYAQNDNYLSQVFEGDEHNEKAWRNRFDKALLFLYKSDK